MKSYQFSIVWLYSLPHSKFFVIPQFLVNLLRDLLGELCFSYSILQIVGCFLFALDRPIDSPDITSILVIQVVDR